jgi:hypothetical protein
MQRTLTIDTAEFNRLVDEFKQEIIGKTTTPSMYAANNLINYLKAQLLEADEMDAVDEAPSDAAHRVEALNLAVRHSVSGSSERNVDDAMRYFNFLRGPA